jgi:hypothetical protein
MQKDLHHHRWTIAEVSLSVFVLFILLVFTYGIFVRTPYMGFLFNPPDGKILSVYVADSNLHTLQTGDTLIQVGPISWHDFYEDHRQDLFEGLRPGDIVNITVQRAHLIGADLHIQPAPDTGTTVHVSWTRPAE